MKDKQKSKLRLCVKDELWDKVKKYKVRKGHKTLNDAVNEILRNYIKRYKL